MSYCCKRSKSDAHTAVWHQQVDIYLSRRNATSRHYLARPYSAPPSSPNLVTTISMAVLRLNQRVERSMHSIVYERPHLKPFFELVDRKGMDCVWTGQPRHETFIIFEK